MEMKKFRCKRCNHRWYPRKPGTPKTCPRCNSPYWQTKSSRVKAVSIGPGSMVEDK